MTRWSLVVLAAVALGACGGGGAKPGADGAAGGGDSQGAAGTTGAAGTMSTGAAGTTSTGAAGTSSTGAAGTTSTGAAGTSASGAAGTTSTGAAGTTATGAAGTTAGGAAPWPSVTDYGAKGPFPIARDMNTGPGGVYDVFRPATLGAEKRRHPIISWANGTLFDIPDYQKLLEHWASHGFVVIAGQTNSTAGGVTHKAGIDWMIAEAARAGSPYFGVLDTKMVGASGHSQGGGASIAAGAQKAGPTTLVTTLPLMPILSYESDKTILGKQTVPMLNINATTDDRDPQGLIPGQIFDAANAELVQAAFIGIHEDAMSAAMHAPTLAWFRLRLMGDTTARAMFYPAITCGLCTNVAWRQVRHKNVP